MVRTTGEDFNPHANQLFTGARKVPVSIGKKGVLAAAAADRGKKSVSQGKRKAATDAIVRRRRTPDQNYVRDLRLYGGMKQLKDKVGRLVNPVHPCDRGGKEGQTAVVLIIPKAAFKRFVVEICDEVCVQLRFQDLVGQTRWSKGALLSLQEAAEAVVVLP